MRPPPTEPRKEDCCNSGCNPCIFDVFQRELDKYNKSKDTDHEVHKQNGISQLEYSVFIIIDIMLLCDNLKIIKLKQIINTQKLKVWWNAGDHFLVKYTSNQNVSCTRAYTPIKFKSQAYDDFDFLMVIKRYDKGLVSNYLFNLKVGDETMWRGPYGHYNLGSNKYKRLVLVAQGTGIAPFMSIIDDILNNEEDMTSIILYFCCRNINEILFRNELYEFNAYWNFSYKIFLSNFIDENECKIKYKEPIVFNKFNVTELIDLTPYCDTQFLLCGSDTFMREYEGFLKSENNVAVTVLF